MKRRWRLGVFSGVLALFVGVVVFLTVVFPYLAQMAVGHHVPLPVPRTVLVWWLVLLVAALTVYVASNTRTTEEFVRPVRAAIRGDAPRWQQITARVVAVVAPLVLGVSVFMGALPRTEPPTATRQQHPGTSGASAMAYVGKENPFRNASPEEREAALVAGRGMYFRDCSPCHGAKLDGDGREARAQSLRPVNFRDPGTIATLVEDAVLWRISEGAPGLPPVSTPWDSAMPQWRGELSEEEIWQIILALYDDSDTDPRVTGVQ